MAKEAADGEAAEGAKGRAAGGETKDTDGQDADGSSKGSLLGGLAGRALDAASAFLDSV